MISQKRVNLSLLKQLSRFGSVGFGAMIIHWCTVLILVPCGLHPLIANTVGFSLAFQLSYWGHRYWTFQNSALSHRKALLRFLIIALSGFLLNQILFAALLKFTYIPYPLALLIVLGVVSLSTFIFSKFWAFRIIE